MQLIQSVAVSGLRSILEASLPEVGDLTTLAGRNSCGKSNFLRALNLFFNNEVEPGKAVVFLRDHFSQPKSKKRRQVAVRVSFRVPERFKFRRELEALGHQAAGVFEIQRTWELDAQRNVIDRLDLIVDGQPIEDGAILARQFINLVHYRYIPNRAVPANILREEGDAIARYITMRMRKGQGAEELLEAFNRSASAALSTASDALDVSGAPIGRLSVSAPESLAEMLQIFGFRAVGAHGRPVSDTEWGAGHQSFILYQILKVIDTDYGQFFGWRQANVWGVEEPESGLHRDLEVELAHRFRLWAKDDAAKLQILQTTHSPVFVMASNTGYWVDIEEGRTTSTLKAIPKLVREAEDRGVAHWVQPILAYPWHPMILLEGARDVEALSHVARLRKIGGWKLFHLPGLDPAQKGSGKSQIITWLRQSGGLISHRPFGCPLVVVFDWDISDMELEKARGAYGKGGERYVLRMDLQHADPALSEDFRGVERFYPLRIVLDAASAGEFQIGQSPDEPISISKRQLDKAKGPLLRRLLEIEEPDDVVHIGRVLDDIGNAISAHPQLDLVL